MDLQILSVEKEEKHSFKSILEKSLQGFKKEGCHVNVWGFDGAFQSGASDNCSQFNQEWDSSRYFS